MSKSYRIRTVDGKGQLIMDCRVCDRESNLQYKHCRNCVLDAMKEHFTISTVVLSDYKERMYHGQAVKVLDMLVSAIREMESLSSRNPVREYFFEDGEEAKGRPACERCSLNPQNMYPKLISEIKEDIGVFQSKYLHYLEKVDANDRPQCSSCIFSTGNDLLFLHGALGDMRLYLEQCLR